MEPKQRRFSVGYTIGTIIALLLIQSYLFGPHPETLAYSDFNSLLKAGKVSDLTLSNQTIWAVRGAPDRRAQPDIGIGSTPHSRSTCYT